MSSSSIPAGLTPALQAAWPGWKQSLQIEYLEILRFWMLRMPDPVHGGFAGCINEHNQKVPGAPRGAVLNARILWTFSEAAAFFGDPRFFAMATDAFHYLRTRFVDARYGGIYWTVSETGEPLEARKQIYAQAFAIYAFAAYYQLTRDSQALQQAIALYRVVEEYSYDRVHGGYTEAFGPAWEELDDMRLSEQDLNEKKSMNTHLHLLEAYTLLYRVWPGAVLRKRLEELIEIFLRRLIRPHSDHLILFARENWEPRSWRISFGHDVETSWLMMEAASVLGEDWVNRVKPAAVRLAEAAGRGLYHDGSLLNEYDPEKSEFCAERHWWVQAEAMVGFFSAWQLTARIDFLQKAYNNWNYILREIKDKREGEWHWGRDAAGVLLKNRDKAGLWKCPYHNSRACLELLRRMT